jgi:glycosyltransferase involved in cell wall biosynthesis
VGGAEVAVKEITKRLGGDFEFDMLTVNLDGRQPAEEQDFNGINRVYRLGRGRLDKYLFPWLAYKKATELQQQNGYDLIWAMMANQAGWAAMKFKRRFPQIPYLLTLQEGDSEWDIWLKTWFIRPIYKAIYRRADQIQAISNFLVGRAKKLGAKCPIKVVPNGVRNEWLSRCDYDQLKQLRNSKIIITASRLEKKNGVEYLIRAMENIDGKLLIIGDGSIREELEKITEELNLKNKIEFIGLIDNLKVYNYLMRSNVFCRPSLSEGLGNSFLEAMGVYVPIVGTLVGGIPDFLKDGETGWFCEVKNPKSIAEKINYILSEKNKVEVERVVENAQKLVTEKYNWNKIVGEMKNIFNKLANGQE